MDFDELGLINLVVNNNGGYLSFLSEDRRNNEEVITGAI